MGVQGFPTLKIVRPGKKAGKPTVEDYQGQRTAKGIVDAVKDKIPNTVKRVTDKNLDEWLADKNETAKAILFSDKQPVSATLRTLAVDFAGIVSIAQIRNKEAKAVETFGVDSYPTLVLLPGGTQDAVKYDGDMKKDAMVEFLSQVAPPNPDCPPPKAKKSKAKEDKKASKSSSKKSAEASTKSETVEEPVKASETPDANTKDEGTDEPIVIPEEEVKPTIPIATEAAELQSRCLGAKSSTCILALLSKDESSEASTSVTASLAAIHNKYGTKLFPFIGVPASNTLSSSLLAELKLGGDEEVHLIATNAKRGWVKKYSGTTFGTTEVEAWVDAIRMGEGKKEKLPDSLVAGEEIKEQAKGEKPEEQEPIKIEVEEIEDENEPEPKKNHDEL